MGVAESACIFLAGGLAGAACAFASTHRRGALSAVTADLNSDWAAVQAKKKGRVDRASFVEYLLKKHESQYDEASKPHFEAFLHKVFDASTALMLPAHKTDLGGHCFRYGALMAGEFYFAAAQQASTPGCGCDTPVSDVLQITK